jgi:DNA invertase Pin-like site-specific DNA recombinase
MSAVAMVGGGTHRVRPGEISLAQATDIICSMKRAAIYCRISSDPLGESKGVERQEQDCLALAEKAGFEVIGIFVDNDTTAFRARPRPKYQQLIEIVRSGMVDVIVAWHPDRLHRNMRELEDFIDLVESAKCDVQTVREGSYDLATPGGRGIARVIGALATAESEHKSARLKRKHEQIAQEGRLAGGGTRPFGYEQDRLRVREDESELIRSAVKDVLNGRTIRSITKEWQDSGVPTVTGARWKPHVIKGILTRGRIAGLRELGDEVVATAVWPAIISPDELTRVRAILLDPSRRTNQRSRRYLLTGGIVRCALCSANLVARPRGDRSPCYVCASDLGGCGKIRSLAEPLDDAITQMVFVALEGPGFNKALYRRKSKKSDTSESILAEIAGYERKLEELSEMFVADEIMKVNYLNVTKGLRAKREEAQRRLGVVEGNATLARFAGGVEVLKAAWPQMSVDDRRLVISSVLDHVPIKPAVRGRNFFDAERIGTPVWRH